ncbi:MAG: cytochrome c oxidase cbb3-type subunit [Alphaproteobacteria bacterium]|jgi:cytochrome c oxidase cbb3-type subunit 3|nr:cytochrome c oxidase cbb3-type subunit [Alphaproteobacteria bacterium]
MGKSVPGEAGKTPRRVKILAAAIAVVGLALVMVAFAQTRDYLLGQELVAAYPDEIPLNPALIAYANEVGRPAFNANCTACHGADMKGSQAKGVPNLTDNVWLYDFGRVSDIERTVLYGIRSGLGKSHNVTDMPAMGRQKALTPAEIKDVIAYTLSLSKHPEDPAAIERGSKLFQDKGVCYDCHSRDATGIPDYGAPNLTDNDWIYGGDEESVYKSVYDGRHGQCPAWIGKLSASTIRAIAVYIHSMSQESPESPSKPSASGAPGAKRA